MSSIEDILERRERRRTGADEVETAPLVESFDPGDTTRGLVVRPKQFPTPEVPVGFGDRLSRFFERRKEDLAQYAERYKERLAEEQAAGLERQREFSEKHPFISTVHEAARPKFVAGLIEKAMPEAIEEPLARQRHGLSEIRQETAQELPTGQRIAANIIGGGLRTPEFLTMTGAVAPFTGAAAPYVALGTMGAGETLMEGGSGKEAAIAAAKDMLTLKVARYLKGAKPVRAVQKRTRSKILRRLEGGTAAGTGAFATSLLLTGDLEAAATTAGMITGFESFAKPAPGRPPRGDAVGGGVGRGLREAGRELRGGQRRPTETETFEDVVTGKETKRTRTQRRSRAGLLVRSQPAQTDSPGRPVRRTSQPDESGSGQALGELFRQDPSSRARDPGIDHILSKIDWAGELSGTRTPLGKIVHLGETIRQAQGARAARRFYQLWFDRFYPVKHYRVQAEKRMDRKLEPDERPDELARAWHRKADAITRRRVEKEDVDEFGSHVGPSLVQILKPVAKNAPRNKFGIRRVARTFREFFGFAATMRELGLEYRGIKSGAFDETFTVKQAQDLVARMAAENPHWVPTAKAVTKWANNGFDWLVRAGRLNKAEADIMKELNPIYVPLARVFRTDVMPDMALAAAAQGRADTLQRIRGSTRAKHNPLEQLILAQSRIHEIAMRARVWNAVMELGQMPGMSKYIVFEPTPKRVTKFSLRRLEKDLEELGVQVKGLDLDRIVTLFQLAPHAGMQRNQMSGRIRVRDPKTGEIKIDPETGRPESRQVTVRIDPHLYDAIEGLSEHHAGSAVGTLAGVWPVTKAARLKRIGATQVRPVFGLFRNPVRDFPTYFAFSKSPWADPLFRPLWGVARDVFARPGSQTARAQSIGMFTSGWLGQDRVAWNRAQDDIMNRAAGRQVVYVMRHPVDAIRRLLSPTEMGPRMAEFNAQMARNRRQHPEWSDESVFIRSFNEGQDVTLNFSGGGLISQQYNRGVAFFNANMLGADKVARQLGQKKHRTKTIIRAMGLLTPIALMKWYENKDKQWYRNRTPQEKIMNIYHEMPDGTVVRVPIPFELGLLFMGLPVVAMDYHYEKDPVLRTHMDGLYEAMLGMAPSMMPDILSPAFDLAVDRNWMGVPIIGDALYARQSPGKRTRPGTKQYAIEISKGMAELGFAWDPIAIEYLLWNYTGGLPGLIPDSGKAAKFDVAQAADYPYSLGGAFLRDKEFPRHQMNVYYSEMKRLTQLEGDGDITPDDFIKLKILKRFERKRISPMFTELREARKNKDYGAAKETMRQMGDVLTLAFQTAGY